MIYKGQRSGERHQRMSYFSSVQHKYLCCTLSKNDMEDNEYGYFY